MAKRTGAKGGRQPQGNGKGNGEAKGPAETMPMTEETRPDEAAPGIQVDGTTADGGELPPTIEKPATPATRPTGAAVFPKLDGLSEQHVRARYFAVTLGGEEPTDEDIAAANDLGRGGMIAAIRREAAPLVGEYLPGRTICPACAGFVRVASSPRGPVRYHTRCVCGATIQTEKLHWRRQPRRRGQAAGR